MNELASFGNGAGTAPVPPETEPIFTRDLLLALLPGKEDLVDRFFVHLDNAMARFDIVTPLRVAAFLAQVLHESGGLRYVRELGGARYFEKYDTGPLAQRLGNTPEADGDGALYCGRGLIQITGRANYEVCGKALGLPLLTDPGLLEDPEYACLSAAWFWHSRKLNPMADARDFPGITRKINGGLNGYADRQQYYWKALALLGDRG